MLTDLSYEILCDIYNTFVETGQRTFSYSFDGDDPAEVQKYRNALDLLEDYGYIEVEAVALGFTQFKLTTYGIDFFQENQSELSLPIIQGDNNIIVNGSNNSVCCFNQIQNEVQNSDLPDELKALLKSFLSEMQDTSLSKSSRRKKISTFLKDITSGSITDTASSCLTTLLLSIFNQFPV